jgi:ABC-2 type transport system ATP-binding protein
VAQGALDDLLDSGSPTLLVSTSDGARAVDVLRDQRIPARLAPDGVRVDVATTPPSTVIETLVRAGVGVDEARRERTGLEEAFARLTHDVGEVVGELTSDVAGEPAADEPEVAR